MRYLAIDPGSKRTGIALGDDITGHVAPLTVVITGDATQRVREIEKLIDEYGPDALVVGLPLNMDGTAGPAAEAAEALAAALESRTGLTVHRFDERLTSYAADQQMARSGLTRGDKKKRRDALAAATILQDFLDQQTS